MKRPGRRVGLVLQVFGGADPLHVAGMAPEDGEHLGRDVCPARGLPRVAEVVCAVGRPRIDEVPVISYVFQLDTARGYVAIALPLGVVSLLFGRWILRALLVQQRASGKHLARVPLVGSEDTIMHLCRQLASQPEAGYLPVAAFIPGFHGSGIGVYGTELPVVGSAQSLDALLDAVLLSGADTVAISGGALIGPETLRQLGWELSARDISMVMAPALTDVAGPRIHTQPVAGLPLIHVTTPKLDGIRGTLKRVFDIAGSVMIILASSPLFLSVAFAVWISSPGPIVYSQVRIGQGGNPFKMYKFRSMTADADAMLSELLKAQGSEDKPLFKVVNDPRVTGVGRVLRRYSLDELPQLFNVFLGSMSLVGPRPQREAEVALYEDYAHRRLIVKPGMSGLWQVSGRSNLTSERPSALTCTT